MYGTIRKKVPKSLGVSRNLVVKLSIWPEFPKFSRKATFKPSGYSGRLLDFSFYSLRPIKDRLRALGRFLTVYYFVRICTVMCC